MEVSAGVLDRLLCSVPLDKRSTDLHALHGDEAQERYIRAERGHIQPSPDRRYHQYLPLPPRTR